MPHKDPVELKQYQRDYYRKRRERWRKASLKKGFSQYGITYEHYLIMLEFQNGVCYICKSPPKKNRLSVDHNHKTGKHRKLLCSYCNLGIGYLERNGGALLAYLKEHEELSSP